MPTLEEQIQALSAQLDSQQAPVLPTLPSGTPDDGTRPGLLGRIGEVLAGGQSPTYRLGGREADAAGNRALLNFGLNMLMASGPARVRPDLLTAAATGLQGAQQSMDLDQRRAAAVAQQDYQQRMELAKLGVEQNRDKLERLKAMLPLLQLQNRSQPLDEPGTGTAGAGGGGAGGGASRQFTGDLEKDRQLIKGWESGGDPTALNYVAKADPSARARGATASGLYGFVDSTWKEGLQMIGGDPAKYPTAASAPPAVQDDVFTAVYKARGTAPWDPSKWGQNWVKNAAGGYDLVKTGTGTGGTTTPPPYKVAGPPQPPPTGATPATPAVPGATQPPAAGTPPPAPGATPAAPATPAQPDDTIGLPPGVPGYRAFREANLRQPTPEERRLFSGDLTPEDKQGVQSERAELERALQNAQRARQLEGGDASTIVAARTKLAEHEQKVREAAATARAKGKEIEAKWWEQQETQLRTAHGGLITGAETRLTADNAVTNARKTKAFEGLDSDVKLAGDRLASFDVLRTLSRQVDGNSLVSAINIQGTPLVDILATGKWGSPETLRGYSVIQAYRQMASLAVKEVKEGMSMGSMSDRDLTFIENMIPRLSQDPFTRELGISLLEGAQRRKRDVALRANALMTDGKMNPAQAYAQAQEEAPRIIANVPDKFAIDAAVITPAQVAERKQWFRDNVRPGQAFRTPDGRVDIYFGDQPKPPGFKHLWELGAQ